MKESNENYMNTPDTPGDESDDGEFYPLNHNIYHDPSVNVNKALGSNQPDESSSNQNPKRTSSVVFLESEVSSSTPINVSTEKRNVTIQLVVWLVILVILVMGTAIMFNKANKEAGLIGQQVIGELTIRKEPIPGTTETQCFVDVVYSDQEVISTLTESCQGRRSVYRVYPVLEQPMDGRKNDKRYVTVMIPSDSSNPPFILRSDSVIVSPQVSNIIKYVGVGLIALVLIRIGFLVRRWSRLL